MRLLRPALVLIAVAILATFAMPAVYATNNSYYYGPSFTVPATIPPGGTINIGLSAAIASNFVAPPSGSTPSCTSQTCSYPLQSCPTTLSFYYSIHKITVVDPNGNKYMLGSAHTSGMFWPHAIGGPVETSYNTPNSLSTAPYPPADALNVTYGDSFTLPFGQGLGGFVFSSNLPNPPNDGNPALTPPYPAGSAGPYYWWTVSGGTNPANVRLDTTGASINPTAAIGTYTIDIEGEAVCGPSYSSALNIFLFFDAGIQVVTPQFPAGAILGVLAPIAALVGYAELKKPVLAKKQPERY